ncbi:peptide-methionine (S)-S-oxide reductase MsrA [Fusibacter tunisiensis]|uniref:Peptide methionine sulfoxide reductase MsrA n=1 Tax=Fusibacter tunisiensis TaxID=1008308 RepID=A0ABS2MT28_9FIRM|nr:peptide-methionine (S)-S-oxide reductase MsrA [Fusibacter tunisiensis]MBM7562560.1 peptide-methionine (S)-S-oxide reductase [Fusibacter tunisiensis]
MKKIVLAGGCFWGMEAYFERFDGILRTEVGYANGDTANPTYQEVCTNTTGHAEVLLLEYNPEVMPLESILEHFWKVIDPTLLNRQGGDIGSQYRTGIYYVDDAELDLLLRSKNKEQEKHKKPIVTEIEPLKCYYPAEDYHQNYLKKNPGGYCHIHF